MTLPQIHVPYIKFEFYGMELRNEKWLHMWYESGAVQEAGGVTKEELTVLRPNRSPKYLRHKTTMTYLSKGMLK